MINNCQIDENVTDKSPSIFYIHFPCGSLYPRMVFVYAKVFTNNFFNYFRFMFHSKLWIYHVNWREIERYVVNQNDNVKKSEFTLKHKIKANSESVLL